MTLGTLTPSSTPARSRTTFARALGGGLAATSMLLVNLGCGCCGADLPDWTWGCLLEADVDGAPAQAEAQSDAEGTIVRLSPSVPGAHAVVVTIPGASLASLPLGEQPAQRQLEISVCDGDASGGSVAASGRCVPVRDAVIEIVDLDNGTARASYTGTAMEDGREIAVEGSFVYGRGTAEGGI
jgi:hypothetical protein